jgi:hypothetical protein
MEYKSEDLNKFLELFDDFETKNRTVSDLVREAQRNNGNRAKIVRNGRKIVVTEKDLWDEVYHLGSKCEAAMYLKTKYPQVFIADEEMSLAKENMQAFAHSYLNMDPFEMTIGAIIRLVRGIIKNEYKNEGK